MISQKMHLANFLGLLPENVDHITNGQLVFDRKPDGKQYSPVSKSLGAFGRGFLKPEHEKSFSRFFWKHKSTIQMDNNISFHVGWSSDHPNNDEPFTYFGFNSVKSSRGSLTVMDFQNIHDDSELMQYWKRHFTHRLSHVCEDFKQVKVVLGEDCYSDGLLDTASVRYHLYFGFEGKTPYPMPRTHPKVPFGQDWNVEVYFSVNYLDVFGAQ